MTPLNFTSLRMVTCLMTCLFLFACSSTAQVNHQQFSEDGYARGYIKNNFDHTHFTPIHHNTVKKPLSSDHQLMMSLLNRPVTADQMMMLAFAQQRTRNSNTYTHYAVEIKGAKNSGGSDSRIEHAYAKLISLDINAISISPPQ